jgi:hypothetical protein
VITALVAVLLGFALGTVVVLYKGPSTFVQFAEPVQDIGDVCAKSTVTQKNKMTVHGPAELSLSSSLYNDTSGDVYLPLTLAYSLAVDKERTLISPFTWQAPDIPLGAYTRIVAGTVVGEGRAATTVTHFRIVDCDAAGVPLPVEKPAAP